jgi:hypothetical protein
MMHRELTGSVRLAKVLHMQGISKAGWFSGRRLAAAVVMGGVMALSACISVNAPDKPIVIELNINIKHELIVQLAQDAEKTMDEHKDIF